MTAAFVTGSEPGGEQKMAGAIEGKTADVPTPPPTSRAVPATAERPYGTS